MSTDRPRLRRLSLFVFVGLVATVTGCSSSSNKVAGGGQPGGVQSGPARTSVTVVVPPIVDVAPVYLAKSQGLFDKEGLDVKINVGQGGQAIAAALQSGSADIGLVNYVSMIGGISNRLPLSLVAEGTRGTPGSFGLVVSKSSSITVPKDLVGKKIGVIATGSISDLTTDTRLQELGLPKGSVSYVNVPLPNLVSALDSGQVAAISVNEPTTSMLLARGGRLVLDGFGGKTAGLPVGGYAASSSWVKKNPDAIKKFDAALSAASQRATDDQAAVRGVLPTYTAIKGPQVTAIALPQFVVQTDVQKVQTVADLMLANGLLKSKVNVSEHLAS